jgi:isocitrate dehydrogenase (NAD+)
MLLSSTLMLRHLGLVEHAGRIEHAVLKTVESGQYRTRDLGGTCSTSRFCQGVLERISP